MARPNHQFAKRQRELAKKKKQEEKRQRKLEKKAEETEGDTAATADPTVSDETTE